MRTAVFAVFVAFFAALPANAFAASAGQIFPTNLYTTHDHTQLTGLRVNLPQPNCTTNPSDCADVAVLDTLDGFNIQPRISIPFSGPIDVSTVSSKTIFMIGDGHVVGINQVDWEPATNTLHVESDQQLKQDTTYLLVVTRGVRDASGHPIDAIDVKHRWKGDYDDEVAALPAVGARPRPRAGRHRRRERLHDAEHHGDVEADPLGSFTVDRRRSRSARTANAPCSRCRSLTGITLNREVGTAPTFASSALPLPRALRSTRARSERSRSARTRRRTTRTRTR